ncbi:MAG: hypothetical protein ACTHU0_03100 [Kofleriaceae bacterium]
MASSIPTTEPKSFAAGDTAQWTRSVADYTAADGYTLRYYFAGPDTFQVDAVESTGGWLVTVTSAQTAEKAAGIYRWRAYAEKGSGDDRERWLVATGTLTLEANLAAAEPGDQQSFAERMVAAIKARLEARAGVDLESYGVAGKQAQKIPFQQLRQELGVWQRVVWREQNPGKLCPTVQVTFG